MGTKNIQKSKFGEFERIDGAAGKVYILEAYANYSDSRGFLDKAGLRMPRYQEILPLLINDQKIRDSLKERWFYLEGKGLDKKLERYTINKEGELDEIKEDISAERTVYVRNGKNPLVLAVSSDEFAASRGERFSLNANYAPNMVTRLIIGFPIDNFGLEDEQEFYGPAEPHKTKDLTEQDIIKQSISVENMENQVKHGQRSTNVESVNLDSYNAIYNATALAELKNLAGSDDGIRLLASVRKHDGSNKLHEIARSHKDLAKEILRKPIGKKLFFETPNNSGRAPIFGLTFYEDIMLDMVKSKEDLKLLVETRDTSGLPVIQDALINRRVAKELIRDFEYIKLLAEVKNKGWSMLHEIAYRHDGIFDMNDGNVVQLLKDTKDGAGWSVYDEISKHEKEKLLRI